jgi:hypothetical protein
MSTAGLLLACLCWLPVAAGVMTTILGGDDSDMQIYRTVLPIAKGSFCLVEANPGPPRWSSPCGIGKGGLKTMRFISVTYVASLMRRILAAGCTESAALRKARVAGVAEGRVEVRFAGIYEKL